MSTTEQSAAVPVHRQIWFDRGCEAFKRSYPTIAQQQIRWDRFYVCPLCRRAFSKPALTADLSAVRLTDEHVPPESIGGKRMVLTCGACNSFSGSAMDSHMRHEADVVDFLKGNVREIKAELGTGAGRVPIRLSVVNNAITATGVPKAANPETQKGVMGDFGRASVAGGWQDFKFHIHLPEYSASRATASWLRSAYLAFFSALGYRFIFRPEMDVVWERIKNPSLSEPAVFRLTRAEESEPMLVYIESPEAFRSCAMVYGHQVVFLPTFGDRHLYERLAAQPASDVKFEGKRWPWPDNGPVFLLDNQ